MVWGHLPATSLRVIRVLLAAPFARLMIYYSLMHILWLQEDQALRIRATERKKACTWKTISQTSKF